MDHSLPVLKALADRNRLRVVLALDRAGELCACQITELLQVAGATVSRHLNLLANAGVVENRKQGRWVFYRLHTGLESEHGELLNWVRRQHRDCPQTEADREALDSILAQDPEAICRQQRGERCCPSNQSTEAK